MKTFFKHLISVLISISLLFLLTYFVNQKNIVLNEVKLIIFFIIAAFITVVPIYLILTEEKFSKYYFINIISIFIYLFVYMFCSTNSETLGWAIIIIINYCYVVIPLILLISLVFTFFQFLMILLIKVIKKLFNKERY